MVAIKVDAKGRLTTPQRLREELGIEPGNVMFVEREPGRDVLRYAMVANPFDALAEHAEQEHRAGKTRSLRKFAAEEGLPFNDE